MLTYGVVHQLQMEVVHVGYKVQRMLQVTAFILSLLAQKVHDVHIP